jgi:hypothetical protein
MRKELLIGTSAFVGLIGFAHQAEAGPINGYPIATTPLNGTEAVIGTQSGATVQVYTKDIANLTQAPSSGNTTITANLTMTGHLLSGGSAPACKTNCASVSGTDTRMAIVGNASITSVAVTFAAAWAATPICVATGNATGIGAIGLVANLTTLTATFTSSTPTIYAACAD